MTIFEYALLRAARQRMTPAQLEIAQKAADLADAGEPGAAEILRSMVNDVLFDRSRPDIPEYEHAPMPPRLLE